MRNYPDEVAPQVAQDHLVMKGFCKEKPPRFDGLGDPMNAEKWIKAMGEFHRGLLLAELYERCTPECYRQRKQNEFWNVRQKAGTVTEYDRTFDQLSRYAPLLLDINEKRAEKFRNGLGHEISTSLGSQGGLTYTQTLSRALTIESLQPS